MYGYHAGRFEGTCNRYKKNRLFLAHLHTDHFGLISNVITDTSKIYCNQPDVDWFRSGFRWDDFWNFARLNGCPENELQAIHQSLPILKFRAKENLAFHVLEEGDTISIGDYVFKCVETPGHSWGHICLYERNEKIFLAGDHILSDITPTIQLWDDDRNPLKEYLARLDKVYKFDVELVLPGHGKIFRNCKERIQELKHYHQKRLDEIISILGKGKKNAFQVASQMTWDIIYDSCELFPVSKKWFATAEAIFHLKFLEEKGVVRKEMRQHKRMYLLNS